MDAKKALKDRRSIRGFENRPVPRQIIEEVLTLATRSISAANIQPWEIMVLTGEVLRQVCEENMACYGTPEDNPFPPLSGIYRQRSVEVAKKLFAAMEISREDKEKRLWWSKRGYRFFDAPVGIVLCMEHSDEAERFIFDMGCLAQNICIAAMEYGLGTCVAHQPVEYERGLRKYLKIPDNKGLVCGIALGYPDPSFPANQVVSPREELDHVVTWFGFP